MTDQKDRSVISDDGSEVPTCVVSYHHEPHGECPGRDSTTCMETTCYATATTGFVGRKPGRKALAYRTCAEHKMPLAFGLVRFGLIATADFTTPAMP